jgi:hypothetical protein
VVRVGAGGRTGGAESTATFRIFEAVCWLSPRLDSGLRLCELRSDGCSACVAAASARAVLGASRGSMVAAAAAAGLVGRTAWSSEAGLTQRLWRHLQSSCAASNFRPWSRRLSTISWEIFSSWVTDSAGAFWRTESRLGRGRLQISSHPWHRSREDSRSRGRADGWLSS